MQRSLLHTTGVLLAFAGGLALAFAADAALVAPLPPSDLAPGAVPLVFAPPIARLTTAIQEVRAPIPRTTWDAAPPPTLRRRAQALSPSSFIVVHHSDFAGSPGPRAILDYHRDEAGFSDIGYHFVVAIDGAVYEGRPIDLVGAHAGISREQRWDKRHDPDEDTIGVVLDGDYEEALPPPAQLASAAAVIRDLRARYGIKAHHVIGHRDVKARVVEAKGHHLKGDGTVCPGDRAYDALPALRLLSEP